jgi:hypothetical protein
MTEVDEHRVKDAVRRLAGVAHELYPELKPDTDGGIDAPGNYSPVVEHFGKVVVRRDDKDYQGDSYVLYHNDDGRVGFLRFGWGSCSGCDRLQGCNTITELDDLISGLADEIKWWDSLAEALSWFESHDWGGDFGGRGDTQKAFVAKAKLYLRGKR